MSIDPGPGPRGGAPPRRRSRRGRVLARAALLAGGIVVGAAGAGPAQVAPGPGRPASPADSAAILDAARAAQARFERTRIAHLPWTWSASRGPCDERIGRFCWWHDEGGDAWEPPPEPAPVVEAREALLAELARAAAALPGDDWIVGQRVRYAVEAGRPGEARVAARRSRADPAWRAALEGYALHAESSFAAAEAAFDRALAAFPDSTRRRWSDPDVLLDPRTGRVHDRLGPGARSALERRIWWLADPLWSVPGNERRSEHFARLALDRMQAGARSTWDVRWGRDLREILLRYGAPIGWERVRRGSGALAGGDGTALVGHEPPGGHRFVPDWEVVGGPTVADREAWALEVERPRSTWAPPYARRFVELDGQVAAFRRGDRVAVVATWAFDPDSLAPDAPVEAAIVASEGPDGASARVRAATRGPTGALRLDAPLRPAVLSVEALARPARVAGRARLALPLPERVSGLLVVEAGAAPGEVPASLEAAVARAVGVARAAPGLRLGVYAELYPPEGAAEARIEVRIVDAEEGGLWRAVGEALGLGGEAATATLAWTEPLDGAPKRAIPFTIRWPEGAEGPRLVEVEVVWPDGRRSVASAPVSGGP